MRAGWVSPAMRNAIAHPESGRDKGVVREGEKGGSTSRTKKVDFPEGRLRSPSPSPILRAPSSSRMEMEIGGSAPADHRVAARLVSTLTDSD